MATSLDQANALAANARCWMGVPWKTRKAVRVAALWQLINGTAITTGNVTTMTESARCLTILSARTRQGIQVDRIYALANP